MKKRLIALYGIFIMLILCAMLASCDVFDEDDDDDDGSSSEQTYWYSIYVINSDDYTGHYSDVTYTFDENKQHYNNFSHLSGAEFLESGSETYSYWLQFFTERNISTSEAKEILNNINSIGNGLRAFNYGDNHYATKIAILYLEKE